MLKTFAARRHGTLSEKPFARQAGRNLFIDFRCKISHRRCAENEHSASANDPLFSSSAVMLKFPSL
jgi:hypothetical protein